DVPEPLPPGRAHGQGVAEDRDPVDPGQLLERDLALVEPERVDRLSPDRSRRRRAQQPPSPGLVAEDQPHGELPGDHGDDEPDESDESIAGAPRERGCPVAAPGRWRRRAPADGQDAEDQEEPRPARGDAEGRWRRDGQPEDEQTEPRTEGASQRTSASVDPR